MKPNESDRSSPATTRRYVLRALTLAVSILGACVVPPSNRSLREEQPAPSPAPPAPPALPGEVPVRLAAHEGARTLRVDGTPTGPLVLEVRGARVVSSAGEERSAFELQAAPGFSGLSIGERTYAGRLRVEARGGALRVTNLVPLEDYVEGVVAAELVLWSAHAGAIEAQAVAARSYVTGTLAHRQRQREPVFVWDDTRDQAYRGHFLPTPSARGSEIAERLHSSVQRTAGRVLMQDGALVDVRFHASCGGHTAASKDVFPDSRGTPTRSVACAPCARLAQDLGKAGDTVRWSLVVDAAALSKLARELKVGSRLISYQLVRADAHRRWLELELVGDAGRTRLEADELRRRLGPTLWKSARVLSTEPPPGRPISESLSVEGLGRGHGVGLCQVGSQEWANAGWRGERILEHYYPGARVVELAARP